MPAPNLRADQRQQPTLSPRLQHAVRLLQLSSVDFARTVHQALGNNPFLEADEHDDEGPGANREAQRLAEAAPASSLQDDAPAGDHGDPGAAGESDREVWQADGLGSGRRIDDDESGALDSVALVPTLAGHLHSQLGLQALPQRELWLAQVIVESLDDDGYLRSELAELLTIVDLAPAATLVDMALALQRVQRLDPAGVAARNLAECLRLQLPAIECERTQALAEAIIDEQLHGLAARDVATIARALARTPAEIEQVCARIRQLDPRPGWRYGASAVHYIVPDVIVRKVRGAWRAQLNPAIVPKVKLNRVIADLFQHTQGNAHPQMASHLQEARWTLRNVDQRFSTILKVADAIVRRQKHFLDFGAMAMKPLGLREIANELALHESTVSRVTNNKYMATPLGVFELKHFFSRALATANGHACSGTAIRGLIKDMIQAERPIAPLSDAEIARQLARQGLAVARRTVTKYRQGMRIESVLRRRPKI